MRDSGELGKTKSSFYSRQDTNSKSVHNMKIYSKRVSNIFSNIFSKFDQKVVIKNNEQEIEESTIKNTLTEYRGKLIHFKNNEHIMEVSVNYIYV